MQESILTELFENEYLEHSYRWFPKMDWVYDYAKQIIEHLQIIDAKNYAVEISSDDSLVVYIRINDEVLFAITKYFTDEKDKNLNVNYSIFYEKELIIAYFMKISECVESIQNYLKRMKETEKSGGTE